MDPVSTIGLASSLLTFIDVGYKVVTGTLETAQTGQAPHTRHLDAVAHDLETAVAKINKPVPSGASDIEKALGEVSARCEALLSELLALLERFKVPAATTGTTRDSFRIAVRRIRCDSKIRELHKSLAEYRSQILLHLVTILSDRQVATQIQLGNSTGIIRTDLRGISDALDKFRTDIIGKLEQVQVDLRSEIRPNPGIDGSLPDQNAMSESLATQLRDVKDALDRVTAGRSEKTPETRILEHVYFGNSMFQREETLKPAEWTTFRWFVEGVSSKGDHDDGGTTPEDATRGDHSPSFHVRGIKAEAASCFQNWLKSGSGVFHISGKAGSGKSTLMKLISSTQRTHGMLRGWADGKRLLFARFYFWASGGKIQSSLEGLHRSILFEILVHQPDLVKEVFREAYSVIADNNWESFIHSRFFTTASFQKAFVRLLNLPIDPRYRICLFVDGLDEYGADVQSGTLLETQREELARSLVDWASNDNVKILVSSRPHSEFIGTFKEEQRVHLHRLTHDDMMNFGCHLFEKHRVFQDPNVQENYYALVEKVVSASDGVFLWTGLTIQRLLASLVKRDSFQSLEKQLEVTPRDLSVLYEKMFSEIDENDRHEAMRMMLLVSEERKHLQELSHPGGVNAMAISWLSSLEDPEFPANQPFLIYTEKEIEERRQIAEARVNGYTRGLLEVNTDVLLQRPSYLRHTIQFFHRSALDFVTASPLARHMMSSSPHLFNLEFYIRLSLTELHFGSLDDDSYGLRTRFARYTEILKRYFSTPTPCRYLIEAYRAAFEQQARYLSCCSLTLAVSHGAILRWPLPRSSNSFDHWVANEVGSPFAIGYLTERTQVVSGLLRPQGELSLLLSAACHQPPRYGHPDFARRDRVKAILALGADIHGRVRVQVREVMGDYTRAPVEFSVWQAWCLYYVATLVSTWQAKNNDDPIDISNDTDMNQILELFLEAGGSSDCYVIMKSTRHRFTTTPSEETGSEISESNASECTSQQSQEGSEEGSQEGSGRGNAYDDDSESDGSAQQRDTVGRQTRDSIASSTWGIKHRPSDSFYIASLGDFIRQAKPANYEKLERLLRKINHTQEVSPTKLSEIDDELSNTKSHFKLPVVQPLDLNEYFGHRTGEYLDIYWIRWEDVTIPGSIEIRVY